MNSSIGLLLCCVVGGAFGYYVQREAPYNVGRNDPYSVDVNPYVYQEPSQRLFWGNQGSNQVGGTGWWATLTNKFPFLGNMFGRMELNPQYGAPAQPLSTSYGVPQALSSQYGVPQPFAAQYNAPQPFSAQYNEPRPFSAQYNAPQPLAGQYRAPERAQAQFYQAPPFNQQQARFASGRDVALTDDAVIVTPPQVPIVEPAPVPAPAPIIPSPEPAPGYQYNKPQYRLELPRK